VKCFEEATSKGQRVEEVISFINDKLNDLKLESDEYREYNELDTQKNAIEYI